MPYQPTGPIRRPEPHERPWVFAGAVSLATLAGFINVVVLGFFHVPVSHMSGAVSRLSSDVALANRTLDWQLWVLSRANPGAQGGPAPAQEQGAIGSRSVKGPRSRPAIRLVDQSKKAGARGEANSGAGAPAGKL